MIQIYTWKQKCCTIFLPYSYGSRHYPWSWRQITRWKKSQPSKRPRFMIGSFLHSHYCSQSAAFLRLEEQNWHLVTPSKKMANFVSRELCFALLFLSLAKTFCFKPVIIVHGILDHASDMKDLASFITKAHPGTNITLISLFEEVDSFKPMWMQVSAMREKIRPVMQEAKDGVHIIGFSQGIS